MAPETEPPNFETVYPRCEFAPLVRIALDLAAWIKKHAKKPWKLRGGDAKRSPRCEA
jgi:hypothetical protein